MTEELQTKPKIIQAAIELIADNGLLKLSFDKLVKLTGISKGGILYHFASKEILLVAILEHIERVSISNYKQLLSPSPYPGRAVLAYLQSTLENHFDQQLYAALVAITAERPHLLSKQSNFYKTLRDDVREDGGDFAKQWTLVAALDSLWLDHTNHLYGLQKNEHAELGKFLLSEARAIVETN